MIPRRKEEVEGCPCFQNGVRMARCRRRVGEEENAGVHAMDSSSIDARPQVGPEWVESSIFQMVKDIGPGQDRSESRKMGQNQEEVPRNAKVNPSGGYKRDGISIWFT